MDDGAAPYAVWRIYVTADGEIRDGDMRTGIITPEMAITVTLELAGYELDGAMCQCLLIPYGHPSSVHSDLSILS